MPCCNTYAEIIPVLMAARGTRTTESVCSWKYELSGPDLQDQTFGGSPSSSKKVIIERRAMRSLRQSGLMPARGAYPPPLVHPGRHGSVRAKAVKVIEVGTSTATGTTRKANEDTMSVKVKRKNRSESVAASLLTSVLLQIDPSANSGKIQAFAAAYDGHGGVATGKQIVY